MSNLLHRFYLQPIGKKAKWRRVLRSTLYSILAFMIIQPALAGAQRVNIQRENESVGNVFKEIRRQTGYQVFFSNDEIDIDKKISVKLKDALLEVAMEKILGKGFEYRIVDKNIVITPVKNNVENLLNLPESFMVKGRILAATGEPLAGASVKVKNSERGTTADQQGRFSITVDSENSILIITYTGYQPREVVIGNKKEIDIRLEESTQTLNETVVTGYQTFSNRNAPGVISRVKPEDLTQKGSISVDQMLEGKVAGVAVTGNIGNPGAPPKIRIRGTSSINGDQEPIWVIDGVIWEEPVAVRNRDLATLDEISLLTLVGGSVAGLNPKDIESINVLKDAAATAIYGVRAANGVIVVTTKRGQSGKARINYSTDLRTNLRPSYNDFNLMNSAERIQLSQDIVASGLPYPFRPSDLGYEGALINLRNKNITDAQFQEQVKYLASLNTDWFDLMFRNSFSQNHNISVSGGTAQTTYYFSASMYDENANAKEAALTRYTANARINTRLRDNLTLDLKIGGNIRENETYHSSVNPFNYATRTSRALPAFNEDGSYAFYNRRNELDYFGPLSYNILNEIDHSGSSSKTREMNAQTTIRYNFLKNFQYEGTAFYSTSTSDVEEWADEESFYVGDNYRGYNLGAFDNSSPLVDLYSIMPRGGILEPYRTTSNNYTLRNSLTFNKNLPKESFVNILLGSETRSNRQVGLSQILPGYFPERGGLFTLPSTSAYVRTVNERNALLALPRNENTVSNYFSVYAAAVYNLYNKYIFNANGRFDGSNKFGKDPKYRYLPTFSGAFKWIVSDEAFMDRLMQNKTFDFLAFNASFGLQGNIKSNAYPSLVTRVNNLDNFGNTLASVVSLGNQGLRWERTFSHNLGLEFGLFNRLNVRADYYYKKGKDLLIDKLVSQVEGRETILLNSGDMFNKGIELTLSGYLVRKANFTWRSVLIGAQNRNRVSKAYVAEPGVANLLAGTAVIEGEQVGTLYAYEFAGLDNAGVPLYYVNDGNKGTARSMGELNRRLIPVGSINPKVSGGFDNTFRYKDLTLVVSLTYSLGAYQRLPGFYGSGTFGYIPAPENNFSTESLSRWKQPGDEAFTNIPVLMDATAGLGYLSGLGSDITLIPDLYNNSDLRTAQISYMRVRALNLSYNLPGNFIRRIAASAASVFLSAQNLWYITTDRDKLNGIDPEVLGASYALPLPKIFNLGLNVSF